MDVQCGCFLNNSMRFPRGTGTASRKNHGWVALALTSGSGRRVCVGGVQTCASVSFRPCIDIHKVGLRDCSCCGCC